ncbi:MAG: outer membrane lipoprotein-sorting protein [Flavobacteriaceae bacterium]|nr:outer membrane lipoprotein-sorting protein [Flavobacteriaceae bacterium]
MKTKSILLCIALICSATFTTSAQTVDEIIDSYFENTGGKANWEQLEALKFTGTLDFGQMTLPFTMIQTKEGLIMNSADLQGQTFYQSVYDGETLWTTNQQSFQAEKMDAEATKNYELGIQDFPDPFLNYRQKGYEVELIGSETIDGTETFKIKLEKKPKMVNGVSTPNIEFYYFEKDNFVPILIEREIAIGPNGLMMGHSKLSEYQEVEGLYFPFSFTEGTMEQPKAQSFTITNIEVNPEIDPSIFKFPNK